MGTAKDYKDINDTNDRKAGSPRAGLLRSLQSL